MRSEVEINLLRDGYERQLARAERAEHENEELRIGITRCIDLIGKISKGHSEQCKWCVNNPARYDDDFNHCTATEENAKCNFSIDIEKFDRLIVRGESDERTE